jgi:Domain of unknown function DUF29
MNPTVPLYDADFYTWTQQQAALLRDGKVHELDLANLAEEIESLGKSDRRALGSHLRGLVMHLLKWHYQSSGRQTGHSWRTSINNHRRDIHAIADDSPSLRRQVPDLLAREYPRSRRDASDETGLPLATFPEACPWTPEQVLDEDFWPAEPR